MPQFDIFHFISQIFWILLDFVLLFWFYVRYLATLKEKEFFYAFSKEFLAFFKERREAVSSAFNYITIIIKKFFRKK